MKQGRDRRVGKISNTTTWELINLENKVIIDELDLND